MSACCVWDFTLSALEVNSDDLKKWLNTACKKWTFQKELSESGYEHYQGRFSLKIKERLTTLKKAIGFKSIHLSQTSNENRDNMFYVIKDETRIEGPWSDNDKELYIPRQYRGLIDNLRPFQQIIWNSYDIFDTRHINIIIDTIGNLGKSAIVSLIELYGRGIDLPCVNDQKQLIEACCDILMAREIRTPGIITFDLPRAMDQKALRGVYSALEQIKKGKVVDLRYRYKEWWFDSPQIWVFTNTLPKLKYLSMDRWILWEITNDFNLVRYCHNRDSLGDDVASVTL